MKQLCLRVLILVTALGLAGCTALLPSSSAVSPSSFDSFEAAQAALEKTVPYKTTLEELKALGFDPQASANVSIIPYPEVVSRLAPYSGVALDALDPGVRDCILAQTQCKAYLYRFGRVDRQRDGNFFLDFFNINRHVQVRGWRFEGLVVVREGIVLFRNSAGEARLDATERTINPLGPFQRSGESSDLLLR
ncbi:MAG: hypothetical protein IPH15_03875 [Comamonadaceae bacterium]|nr:hypothetical protein [Comamonadaceae bacterium]